MTLTTIRAQLVSILCQQETFGPQDFAAVRVAKELEPHKEAVIRRALDDLVGAGMLAALPRPGAQPNDPASQPVLWVLTQPIGSAGQTVHLSMHVANGIAETINTFFDAHETGDDRVDPLNIHEGHIITLLDILGDVLSTDPDDPAAGGGDQ